MSGRRGDEPPLVVDVGGLPSRYQVPAARAQRRLSWTYVALGSAYGVLQLVSGEVLPLFLVLGAVWVLMGAVGLLVPARSHLLLQPEGVRHVGAVGRGRLTPWSEVAEVRPPGTFHPVAHLRAHGGRFAETTDLAGMSPEDALELQRRLEAAQEERAGGAPTPDGAHPGA